MSDKKSEPRTPGYKHRQDFIAIPSTSSSKVAVQFHTPNKRSREDTAVPYLEDEQFPEGYTFLETLNTPGKSTVGRLKDMENNNKEDIEDGFIGAADEMPKKGNGLPELSLVSQYDEIIKSFMEYCEDDLTDEFLEFAEHQELCRLEWHNAVQECKRLQAQLDKANEEIGDFANKLRKARCLLDKEKKLRRRAEEERNALEQQMMLARDLLFSDKSFGRIPEDTKEKLAFLNNNTISRSSSNVGSAAARLNTISEVNSQELNSTGSLLSDLSYSRSEDGLDVSQVGGGRWKRTGHVSDHGDGTSPKKRRSASQKVVEINPTDKIVATTTLSVSKEGPITATSIIEAVPHEPQELQNLQDNLKAVIREPKSQTLTVTPIETLWLKEIINGKNSPAPMGQKKKNNNNNNGSVSSVKRQHSFVSKTMIRPDTCGSCNQRIGFAKIVLKCKECRGICHTECKHKLPLPCIPLVNTPTQKGVIGTIADYAPTLPPMVPALIIHCINEIELRGLNEIGIYRVPGSERDVKMLKEKFLRSKSAPVLNDFDVHAICGVVKDFLRSLREPLITQTLWKDFVQVAELNDIKDVAPLLYQAISQLPQPNRDTLAYIMLHLHIVAESRECKMPIGNLSKIFGPTIIGYSSQDPDPQSLLMETRQQAIVMEYLMNIPKDFWKSYVNLDSKITTPRSNIMIQTPSTETLAGPVRRGFFTPLGSKSVQHSRKKRRFFATPPMK